MSAAASPGSPVPVPERLAEVPAGAVLASLLEDIEIEQVCGHDTVEVMLAEYRVWCRQTARFYRAVLETGLRRPFSIDTVERVERLGEFAAEEARAALVWSRTRAEGTISFAFDLFHRLPVLGEAMFAGELDEPRARAFTAWTDGLTGEHAQQVCAQLLPEAAGMTVGELIERIKRACLAIDPAWAEKRYRAAVRTRRVRGYLGPDGTGTLTGQSQPAERVIAACEHIDALARACKRAGDRRKIDHIRSDLFLGLTDGTLEGLTQDEIIAHVLANPYVVPGETDSGDDTGSDGRPGGAGGGPRGGSGNGRTGGSPGNGNPRNGGPRGHGGSANAQTGGSPRYGGSAPTGGSPRGNGQTGRSPDSGNPSGGGNLSGHGGGTSRGPGSGNRTGGGNEAGHDPSPSSAGVGSQRSGHGGSGPRGSGASTPAEPSAPEVLGEPDEPAGPAETAEPAARLDKPAEPPAPEALDEPDEPARPAETAEPGTSVAETEPGDHGSAARPAWVPELRVQLGMLMGLNGEPGEVPGWGYLPAWLARHLVGRMHAVEWRYALCDTSGHVIDGGLITTRPATPDGARVRRDARRGGIVEIALHPGDPSRLIGMSAAGPATGAGEVAWAPVLAELAHVASGGARQADTRDVERRTPGAVLRR